MLLLPAYICENPITNTTEVCNKRPDITWNVTNYQSPNNICEITLKMKSGSESLIAGQQCLIEIDSIPHNAMKAPEIFVPSNSQSTLIKVVQDANLCRSEGSTYNEPIKNSPGIGVQFLDPELTLFNNTLEASSSITFRFRLSATLDSTKSISLFLHGFHGSSSFSSDIQVKKAFCGNTKTWYSSWNHTSETLTFSMQTGNSLQAMTLCQLTVTPETSTNWNIPKVENITVEIHNFTPLSTVAVLTHFGFSATIHTPLTIYPAVVDQPSTYTIEFTMDNDLNISSFIGLELKDFTLANNCEFTLTCNDEIRTNAEIPAVRDGDVIKRQIDVFTAKGSRCLLNITEVTSNYIKIENANGDYKLYFQTCIENCTGEGRYHEVSIPILKSSAILAPTFEIEMKRKDEDDIYYKNIFDSLAEVMTDDVDIVSSLSYDTSTYPLLCNVTEAHVKAKCLGIPPNIGIHNISIRIGDQTSPISSSTVEYSKPEITTNIVAIDTSGNELVEINGLNFDDGTTFAKVEYGPYIASS